MHAALRFAVGWYVVQYDRRERCVIMTTVGARRPLTESWYRLSTIDYRVSSYRYPIGLRTRTAAVSHSELRSPCALRVDRNLEQLVDAFVVALAAERAAQFRAIL